MVYLSLLGLCFFNWSFAADSVCQNWFRETRILPGKECLLSCATAKIGMGTFYCSNYCEEFCKIQNVEKAVFNVTSLYPGLSVSERALVTSEPKKALKAYQMSWKAEELCSERFSRSRTNDGSDACRHFVWAILLFHSVGGEFAKVVLDAHENEPDQPESERAMDLANNRLGLLFAPKIQSSSPDFEHRIMKLFDENIKSNSFVILRRK